MFHGPDLSVYLTFLLHQNQYPIPLSAYRLDFVVVSDILEKNNCLVKVNYPPILHEVSDSDRITISVRPQKRDHQPSAKNFRHFPGMDTVLRPEKVWKPERITRTDVTLQLAKLTAYCQGNRLLGKQQLYNNNWTR